MPKTILIIPAAGSSSRFGAEKLFLQLGEREALQILFETVQLCPEIDGVLVAARDCDIVRIKKTAEKAGLEKLLGVVRGGASRQASVAAALEYVPEDADYIAVHDGDRPLATPEIFAEVCKAAQTYGAAIPVMPVTDTVKELKGSFVARTVPRELAVNAQTPQVFAAEFYRRAMKTVTVLGRDMTDDSQLIEFCGGRVFAVKGERTNIKITRPEDAAVAAAFAEELL